MYVSPRGLACHIAPYRIEDLKSRLKMYALSALSRALVGCDWDMAGRECGIVVGVSAAVLVLFTNRFECGRPPESANGNPKPVNCASRLR